MNTPPKTPPEDGLFNNLGYFSFQSAAPSNSIYSEGACLQQGQPDIDQEAAAKPASPPHLQSDVTTLLLKSPLCPSCKGQKYGFTAYFHNSKIFSEPPHELIGLVEKSYILKDRLESLLVTYTMRVIEHSCIQEAEMEIGAWGQQVEDLLGQVVASAAGIFELGSGPIEEVGSWTTEMVRQIGETVWGRDKMEMPKGRLRVLLLEFRKLWEGVWKGFLLDQKMSLDNIQPSLLRL